MSTALTYQRVDQAALSEMKSRHGRVMCRLAEMAEAAVERAHARVMAVDDGPEFDAAVATFDRVARCLRLSMALEAKLFREHRTDRREEGLHTYRAREGIGQGLAYVPDTPWPQQEGYERESDEREGEGPIDSMIRTLGIDPDLPLDSQINQIRQHIERKLSAAEAGWPEPEPTPPETAADQPVRAEHASNPPNSLDILLARVDAPHPDRSESQRNPPAITPEQPFPYRDYS